MKILLQLFFVLLVLCFSSCSERIIDEEGVSGPEIIAIELRKYMDIENPHLSIFDNYQKLVLTMSEKSLRLLDYDFSGDLIYKSCAMEFTDWETVERTVHLDDFEVPTSLFYTCVECEHEDMLIIIHTEGDMYVKVLEQGATTVLLEDLIILLESEYDSLWPCS